MKSHDRCELTTILNPGRKGKRCLYVCFVITSTWVVMIRKISCCRCIIIWKGENELMALAVVWKAAH
jgi:hypothetical protein